MFNQKQQVKQSGKDLELISHQLNEQLVSQKTRDVQQLSRPRQLQTFSFEDFDKFMTSQNNNNNNVVVGSQQDFVDCETAANTPAKIPIRRDTVAILPMEEQEVPKLPAASFSFDLPLNRYEQAVENRIFSNPFESAPMYNKAIDFDMEFPVLQPVNHNSLAERRHYSSLTQVAPLPKEDFNFFQGTMYALQVAEENSITPTRQSSTENECEGEVPVTSSHQKNDLLVSRFPSMFAQDDESMDSIESSMDSGAVHQDSCTHQAEQQLCITHDHEKPASVSSSQVESFSLEKNPLRISDDNFSRHQNNSTQQKVFKTTLKATEPPKKLEKSTKKVVQKKAKSPRQPKQLQYRTAHAIKKSLAKERVPKPKISTIPQNTTNSSGGVECGICGRHFPKSSCLGGHFSKAHPGMSQAYAHKMKVRESRASEREALQEAKDIYRQQMMQKLLTEGVAENQIEARLEDMAKKDRSKVTQIKKDILTEDYF